VGKRSLRLHTERQLRRNKQNGGAKKGPLLWAFARRSVKLAVESPLLIQTSVRPEGKSQQRIKVVSGARVPLGPPRPEKRWRKKDTSVGSQSQGHSCSLGW